MEETCKKYNSNSEEGGKQKEMQNKPNMNGRSDYLEAQKPIL
jgi:hypothetical protein